MRSDCYIDAMADGRFFHNAGEFTLEELVAEVTGQGGSAGLYRNSDSNKRVRDVAPLDTAGAEDISFLDNPKYADALSKTKAGACIVNKKYAEKAPANTALIISENPYHAYAVIAAKFYPDAGFAAKREITSGAYINPTAEIGSSCHIGENSVIAAGVKIGDNCIIGAGVNISHAIIGDNVIIHNGVCIGQDGFGFALNNGRHVKVPQLGRVIIEDDVEIGANSCIDRGSGPDTVIGGGTRIDNLVQIGHNAQIGKGCVIVSQVGISGSTRIGNYVAIGGQAGIAGHLTIGDGAQIAAQSGVERDIPAGATVCGMPAIPIKQFYRQAAILKRMTRK